MQSKFLYKILRVLNIFLNFSTLKSTEAYAKQVSL